MTTEEKAKAYDIIIQRVTKLYETGATLTKEQMELLFPELKESEDERMMKNIRLAILSVEDAFWKTHGLTAKEAISYLEKQKEQSKWPHVEPISEEEELCLMPQEQKPADKEQDSIAFLEQRGYTIVPPHAPVSIVPSSEVTLTKWSEEDEQYLLICKNALSKYQRSDQWDANIISNWLERRLKSFLCPQSKQEWSKRDKKILQSLHHVMNCADAQNTVKQDGLSVEDVCEFLFSIDPC